MDLHEHTCCDGEKIYKGLWTPEEDEKLVNHMNKYGMLCTWSMVPKMAGLKRCGKSCRLRWMNYLQPDIKRGNFSEEEANIIFELRGKGMRWAKIAKLLPGRSDNEIKNFFNSRMRELASNRHHQQPPSFQPNHQPQQEFVPHLIPSSDMHHHPPQTFASADNSSWTMDPPAANMIPTPPFQPSSSSHHHPESLIITTPASGPSLPSTVQEWISPSSQLDPHYSSYGHSGSSDNHLPSLPGSFPCQQFNTPAWGWVGSSSSNDDQDGEQCNLAFDPSDPFFLPSLDQNQMKGNSFPGSSSGDRAQALIHELLELSNRSPSNSSPGVGSNAIGAQAADGYSYHDNLSFPSDEAYYSFEATTHQSQMGRDDAAKEATLVPPLLPSSWTRSLPPSSPRPQPPSWGHSQDNSNPSSSSGFIF